LGEIKRRLLEVNDSMCAESIDTEIKELKKKLLKYDRRRSNLLEAFELGEFDKDEILDRLSKLKILRSEDESKMNELIGIRDNMFRMKDARVKLDELYDRVTEGIHNCTSELKKLAFDALDIKAYASTDKIEIQGVIPLELPTTAQTSA